MINKITNFIVSKKFTIIASFVGLFLLSTGISVILFSYVLEKPKVDLTENGISGTRSKINLNLPRTEECPINGAKFTNIERDIWQSRRPITVVIENHVDSRPPSGVSKADVVYEAVAEGGITRFLNVFYCGVSAEDTRIGPIRSVRVYFVELASEYGGGEPLFVHSGGANSVCGSCPGGVKARGQVAPEADAFRLLANIGWRKAGGNALDAGTNIGFPVVWRDYERIPGAATEHTFMGSTDKLFEEGTKRGFGFEADGVAWNKNFDSWKFADDKAGSGSASNISFSFWDNKPDYDVEWRYDPGSNSYKRFSGGKEHIDMDTKTQLSAKNVVIQFTKERGPVDKEGHMLYTTTGTGEDLIFQNGGVLEGTWEKDTRTSRTKFMDKSGREISYVRGTIWIEIVPVGNEIRY